MKFDACAVHAQACRSHAYVMVCQNAHIFSGQYYIIRRLTPTRQSGRREAYIALNASVIEIQKRI